MIENLSYFSEMESNFASIVDHAKKQRSCSTSSMESNSSIEVNSVQRDLEFCRVKELFEEYDSIEGDDILCCICGK